MRKPCTVLVNHEHLTIHIQVIPTANRGPVSRMEPLREPLRRAGRLHTWFPLGLPEPTQKNATPEPPTAMAILICLDVACFREDSRRVRVDVDRVVPRGVASVNCRVARLTRCLVMDSMLFT